VLAAFEQAHAAIAPVYSMADLLADPHMAARDAIVEVDGVRMPGVVARLSETPGAVRHAGRVLGADTDEVLTGRWAPRAEDAVAAEPEPGRETPRGVPE
jgi:crotonobetainyl-CoA:carnitine CoA-transferase CaiB-like acyl-CoA transferase